uniref:Uncharacterized protein n=1 Tax=Megaselia scalaris TaxID=36166 RepID=T1H039_MEGSC
MFKFAVALLFAIIACVAGKPGIVAPLAYTAPVAYSAAYTAPVAYSAAYTAPVAYAAPLSYSNSFLYKAPPTKIIAAPSLLI